MPRSWRGRATVYPACYGLTSLHLSRGPRCTASKSLQIHSQPRVLPRSLGPRACIALAFQQCALGFEKGLGKTDLTVISSPDWKGTRMLPLLPEAAAQANARCHVTGDGSHVQVALWGQGEPWTPGDTSGQVPRADHLRASRQAVGGLWLREPGWGQTGRSAPCSAPPSLTPCLSPWPAAGKAFSHGVPQCPGAAGPCTDPRFLCIRLGLDHCPEGSLPTTVRCRFPLSAHIDATNHAIVRPW